MTLQILGKTFVHKVWVCNKINDLIIGADFINSNHLQYDTLSRSIHFRNKPHAPILSLTEITSFEALTTTIVKIKFSGDLYFRRHILRPFSMVITAFYKGDQHWYLFQMTSFVPLPLLTVHPMI